MKNFVLTGPPGAGKTAIIRQLEIDGLNFGFEIVYVKPDSVSERVATIKTVIGAGGV